MTMFEATFRTMVLFSLMAGLMAVVGFLLAPMIGTDPVSGLILFLLFAALFNMVALFWGDKLVLMSYRAKQLGPNELPHLHAMVERVASAAGVPKPRVFVIPTDTPNAFATGRSPKKASVAFTRGILKVLDDKELEGVAAHEMAHVRHRDTLVMVAASTIAGAIGAMFRWAFFGSLFGGRGRGGVNPFVILAVGVVASLVALLIQMAISRAREFKADAGAAQYTGRPLELANALKKLHSWNRRMPFEQVNPGHASLFIVNPLSGGGVSKLFSTHPPMEERVARLERMAGVR